MMTDLPAAIRTYEINLSKGKIIYGIKELNGSGFGFFLYSNKPGDLKLYARIPSPALCNLMLFDLQGRLVFKESLYCQSVTSLISFRPGYIPTGILSVEGSGYKQGYKVTGSKDESIGVSIADESTLSSDFSGKTFFKDPTDSDDFIFTPGDSVRFSVFHHDIYPGSLLCQPKQDDSIVLDVSRPCPGFPLITDYDGNTYTTVQIGTQCWMRENMNTTHYAEGTALIDGTGAGNIGVECTIKYWFNYEDHPDNNALYGRLYTWCAVMNGNDGTSQEKVQGICPSGWHVPGDEEWKTLEMFLGMSREEADYTNEWRGTNEGGKLKESGTFHWGQYNFGATNESGFTALPGGQRLYDGSWNSLTTMGYWWTSTKHSQVLLPISRMLSGSYSSIYRYVFMTPSDGISVRCVKN
jgi:uncharacterized protein (TIGR02145 family)